MLQDKHKKVPNKEIGKQTNKQWAAPGIIQENEREQNLPSRRQGQPPESFPT